MDADQARTRETGRALTFTIAHEHKSQTRAREVQAEAKPLAKHGGDRKKVVDQGADCTHLVSKGSESSEYIASRLKRDHPEIAAAVERGDTFASLAVKHRRRRLR